MSKTTSVMLTFPTECRFTHGNQRYLGSHSRDGARLIYFEGLDRNHGAQSGRLDAALRLLPLAVKVFPDGNMARWASRDATPTEPVFPTGKHKAAPETLTVE